MNFPLNLLFISIIISLIHAKSPQTSSVDFKSFSQTSSFSGYLSHYAADNFQSGDYKNFYVLHLPTGNGRDMVVVKSMGKNIVENLEDFVGDFVEVRGEVVGAGAGRKRGGGSVSDGSYWESYGMSGGWLDVSEIKRITPIINPAVEHLKRDVNSIDHINSIQLLIIIVNFKDNKVECSRESIYNSIWGATDSVSSRFEDNSYSQITISKPKSVQSNIIGPITIDIELNKEKECNYAPNNWANLADQQALNLGVNFSLFTHYAYVLPQSDYLQKTLCQWNGLGNIGCGIFCRIWVSNCDRPGVYIHELGHNLGLLHAASHISLNQNVIPYGDPTSIMGNIWWDYWYKETYYFNAPHKVQLNWITQDLVKQVTTSGTYYIAPFNQIPYNRMDNNPFVIKIRRPDRPDPSQDPYYYFSYITGEGRTHADRCIVHVFYNTVTPSEFITSLVVGDWFTDITSQFSVLLKNVNSTHMELDINFACLGNLPSVSLAPSIYYYLQNDMIYFTSSINNPFNLSLIINNNDNTLCPPIISNYSLHLPFDAQINCLVPNILIEPTKFCVIDCIISPHEEIDHKIINNRTIQLEITGRNALSNELYQSVSVFEYITVEECLAGKTEIQIMGKDTVVPNQYNEYRILISNNDSFHCDRKLYHLEIVLPPYWTYTLSQNDIILPPSQNISLLLNITAIDKNQSNDSLSIKIITKQASEQIIIEKYVTFRKLRTDFNLLYDPDLFSTSTREVVKYTVYIENEDDEDYGSTEFFYKVVSMSSDDIYGSLQPPSLVIRGGEKGLFYVVVHTPYFVENSAHNISIEVNSIFHSSVSIVLNLSLQNVPCVRQSPPIYINCQEILDRSHTNYNGIQTCRFFFLNQDSWTCPVSTFNISISDAQLTKLGITYNVDQPKINLCPSNWIWTNIQIHLNESWKLPNYTMPLIYTVAVMDTNSSFPIHTAAVTVQSQVGSCFREPLSLNHITPPEALLHTGSEVRFSVKTIAHENPFCAVYQGINHQINAISIPNINTDIILVNREPSALGWLISVKIPEDISQSFNISELGLYNITLKARDVNDPKLPTAISNILIRVNQSCIVKTTKTMPIPTQKIEIGPAQSLQYEFQFQNMDSLTCENSNYNLQLYPISGPPFENGINAYFVSTKANTVNIDNISPNQTVSLKIQLDTHSLLTPGSYNFQIFIRDNELIHQKSEGLSLEVLCSPPRPIRNFNYQEFHSSLGLNLGNLLYWNACMVPNECCCPCTYEVMKDDIILGISSNLSFTDRILISTVGTRYNYTVTVIDKNNRRSHPYTCESCKLSIVTESGFDLTVFVIIGISIFCLLGTFCIWRKLLKKDDEKSEREVKNTAHEEEEEEEEEEIGLLSDFSGRRKFTDSDEENIESDEETQ